MADELVDVIDEKNNVVGQALRSEVHSKGMRHRVSAVLLKNGKGEYLIPTAAESKAEAGKLFHSAGGHVRAGDNYKAAAGRELEEETGVKVQSEKLRKLGDFWTEKERFEVYGADYDPAMGKVVLNEEQVDEQWISRDGLEKIFKENPDRFSHPLFLSCKMILGFSD